MARLLPDLAQRSHAPERMDDPEQGGRELESALRQLRWINRLLGAVWPTLEGVHRIWVGNGRPRRLSVMDVGAGSGDLNTVLLRWADRKGVELTITLVDVRPEICAVADALYAHEPRVRVQQGDVFNLEPESADVITAALFLHHFPTGRLPALLRTLLAASRWGVVANDIHRHWFAWGFIALATRMLSRNPMIRHDAPLSVLRAFTAGDLRRLQAEPGLEGLTYAWRPFFRYLIILPRPRTDATHTRLRTDAMHQGEEATR